MQALRVLDNVMDTIIDQPVKPPPPWSLLERCGPHADCNISFPLITAARQPPSNRQSP